MDREFDSLDKDQDEDTRDIRDFLKYMPTREIREEYLRDPSPFAVLLANLEKDVNVGATIRTANNFRAGRVIYYGRKKYNRISALGSYLYMDLQHCAKVEDLLAATEGYTWVGLEQNKDSVPLAHFQWPARPLIVLGHESSGFNLLPEIAERVEQWTEIPSLGTMRSLNVAAAGAIAMWDFLSKTGAGKGIGESYGQ